MTQAVAPSRKSTITALGQAVRDAIGSVVPRGSRVALLDFPEYPNVGDSAIWLGQLAALRELGVAVAYAAGRSTYDPRDLRRAVGASDGFVLLSGGGNFGDLWPRHGEFRARVIEDLPDYPLVQLPQSIHFTDPRNREATRVRLQGHPRLTLMVRDEPSRLLAEQELGQPAVLCPDAGFALGPIPRPCPPDQSIVWQSRNDRERSGPRPAAPLGLTPVDWLREPHGRARLMNGLAGLWRRSGGRLPSGVVVGLLRQRAEFRVRYGCRILARGRVVVTNRLHGQILAMLMGIPHFVSDTQHGKLGAFHRTWLDRAMPDVMCASEEEALARARVLAESLIASPIDAHR